MLTEKSTTKLIKSESQLIIKSGEKIIKKTGQLMKEKNVKQIRYIK